MMYEVYLNDELLFYPNDEEHSILNATLDQSLNEAGVFECDVPLNNPMYDAFGPRSSMIRVLKDGEEIFLGEVHEVKQNFDFTQHIYAVGELAFLFDSIQPQARYQGTPLSMFTAIVTNHNSQVEDKKKFTVGQVLVTDPNDYVYHYTNYEDTLTALREKMCNTLNGYLRIRKVGNTRYLDLVPLNLYGTYCGQTIQFGENLLEYSCNISSDSIATAVIPIGGRLEEDQRTASAVEGLDEYTTIKSVNGGVDYIYNQTAVNNHGWIKVVQKWDDVYTPSILLTKAQDWLASAQYATMVLEINAVDMSILNSSIDAFEVGDTVCAIAEPFGMNTTFPVQKKKTYLNDLSKNYITLSNSAPLKSFTSQASNAVSLVQSQIPSTSPILEEAKSRALSMLLSETMGGHVVFEYDSNDRYIEAISICNAATIDASTSRWRWSMGAFGYLKRDNINQPWTDVGVALNVNGEIVADFITAGNMSADRLNAGSIDASQIAVTNLNASNITSGTMNCDRLNGGTINGQTINGGTISGSTISGNTISGGTVSGATISGSSISGGELVNAYTDEQGNVASVEIKNGMLKCSRVIVASGFAGDLAGSVAGGNIYGTQYQTTNDGGQHTYTGANANFSIVSKEGAVYGFNFVNGLLVGFSSS